MHLVYTIKVINLNLPGIMKRKRDKVKVKKSVFLLIIVIMISIFQACITSSSQSENLPNPTNTPRKTATRKPTSKYTNTPKATPTNSYYALATVTADACNLREGPGTEYAIVGYTEMGEVLEIYGVNKELNWFLLDEKDSVWIWAFLVSLDTDISNIPILGTPQPTGIYPTYSYEAPEPTVIIPTYSYEESEPTEFAGCPFGCTYHPPGCDIKGNISISSGEKIYHVPGGRYYDETVISPEYGERWFCTEQEAINNGWRKSKQ